MAHICTKFYTGKNHTPQAILLSKFNSRKIQDGGGRHFEIHVNGHNYPVTFAQNLAQRLKANEDRPIMSATVL